MDCERIYIDISSNKEKRFDNYLEYCCSYFSKSKNYLKVKIFGLLTDLKIASIDIKFICFDNANEN
jgi:hypothetical protein